MDRPPNSALIHTETELAPPLCLQQAETLLVCHLNLHTTKKLYFFIPYSTVVTPLNHQLYLCILTQQSDVLCHILVQACCVAHWRRPAVSYTGAGLLSYTGAGLLCHILVQAVSYTGAGLLSYIGAGLLCHILVQAVSYTGAECYVIFSAHNFKNSQSYARKTVSTKINIPFETFFHLLEIPQDYHKLFQSLLPSTHRNKHTT
jgi:hypothetical protein